MTLAFVLPGRLDQFTGGYLYDRHIVDGLRALGRQVEVVSLPGRHPDADGDTRAAATEALRRLPDGITVVIDGLGLPGLADGLLAERQRLRLVGFIHHPLSLETGLDQERVRHFERLEATLWPGLKGVICPSEHTAKAVRASGLPADRVAVVAPGTTPPTEPLTARSVRSPTGPLQLLAVGSITPRKGHLLLVEALARLHEANEARHLDWRLTCIGSLDRDPDAAAALRACIKAHGLGDRIALLGEQAPDELAKAYQRADLFVLPSHHEGYGMVFAEALAHGLPIIATTAGAIPDTVPAAAALLVPPGEVAALQAALQQALTDTRLRAQLTTAATQAARTLPTWAQAVRRWADALDQVSR